MNQANTTAAEAYTITMGRIADKITSLQACLANHRDRQAQHPDYWTYPGDANRALFNIQAAIDALQAGE